MRVECWKLFDKSGTTLRGVKLQKYKISWKRAKKSTTQSTTDGKAVVSNFERAKHRLRTMTERYGFSFFKIASISRHDADSRQPTDWQSIERTLMHVCIYIYMIYVYIHTSMKELLFFYSIVCFHLPHLGSLQQPGAQVSILSNCYTLVSPSPYVSPCVHFRDMSGFRTRSNEQDKTRQG